MNSIPEGFTAHHALTVTDAMTVDFEQESAELGKLHPVYATYWLVKHAELVGRKIILPFLAPGEAGIGAEVALKHTAPALPGMEVRLEARFLRQEKNRVYASVRAWNELGDLIGEGTTTQVIVAQERLEGSLEALRARWARARETSYETPQETP